jgi:hypothetical protein
VGVSAAVLAVTVTAGVAPSRRRVVGAALMLWFAALLTAGAAGAFAGERPLLVGVGAATPLLAAAIATVVWPALRAGLDRVPLPALIAVHAVRGFGAFFVLLYAGGRMSGPFGPVAGWGDVAAAVAAPLVAWFAARKVPSWHAIVLGWNALAMTDLFVAVGLGITSAPGSPLRLFEGDPGTALMGSLPWVLIPTFIVPLLVLIHVAVFRRVTAAAPVRRPSPSAVAAPESSPDGRVVEPHIPAHGNDRERAPPGRGKPGGDNRPIPLHATEASRP